jgi:hypothetical protein
VVQELDNLTLVNLLLSVTGKRSEIACLRHQMLSMGFISFSISFVKWKVNEAAHLCSKLLLVSLLSVCGLRLSQQSCLG